jgi:spoIIIJ-associated protein
VVDSEGYRQRRIEAIQGMAHRTARRAVRERRSLSLPPMPAAERRIVHLFLQENPKVTTSSEGKEDSRKVVVSPIQ